MRINLYIASEKEETRFPQNVKATTNQIFLLISIVWVKALSEKNCFLQL